MEVNLMNKQKTKVIQSVYSILVCIQSEVLENPRVDLHLRCFSGILRGAKSMQMI